MNSRCWTPLRSSSPQIGSHIAKQEELGRQAIPLPEQELSALPVTLLANDRVKARIQQWWLSPHDSFEPILRVEGLTHAVIRTSSGRTSIITAVDPLQRRVQTRSGTVYQLCMPEATFAAKARTILKALGF